MTYPKMIIFDYGHTLLYEPGWDSIRGEKTLFEYLTQVMCGIAATTRRQMLKFQHRWAYFLFGTIMTQKRTTKTAQ